MKATDVLSEEHRVIERVLDSLEAGANRLEAGEPISPEFFLSAVEFVRGFADGCHHRKEEGSLFVRMEAAGVSREGGPIGVMLAEHELGRQFIRSLEKAALALQAGDENGRRQAIESSRGYINLLRQHILKEDRVLFPMANQVIPANQYDQVWEDFEHVEHEETGEGVHEKYLALADRLSAEVGK